MRNMLLGTAAAAALAFSFEARADNEVTRGQAAVELNDRQPGPAIAYRGEASTPAPDRSSSPAEAAEPCQPGASEGSAGGEPATSTGPERSSGAEEFKREVWTAP